MRLVGVAMVRNDADVIEAFVGHNAALLDALIVIDHGSVDGTRDILLALAEEGLPLTIESESELAQRQPEVLTRAASDAFAKGADVVFPLDADEFLKVSNRALLDDVLAKLPSGLNAALQWQTYVPEGARCPPEQPLRGARRRLAVERHGLHKLALTRAFAGDADAVLGPGSHTIRSLRGETNAPSHLARLRTDVAALAHLPVRSAEQLMRKVTIGWLAHRAARRSNADLAFHWRELYEAFDGDRLPSPNEVATIAANYGVARARWLPLRDIAFIDDPLPPGMPSRYRHLIGVDAEARVRAFAERLASADR